ncbi:MAG TPA: hypothetical protein VMT03_17465 [Polyangia bacterium]|nr:hypothetical protein [Polyangia bacterium]
MQKAPTLTPGERWESDRGVCVEIRALSGPKVILEFVGNRLGPVAMSVPVFQRAFRHLVRPAWRNN